MTVEEINSFLEEFQNASDRATAVLGAAYLDEVIGDLLVAFMIDENSFVNASILGRGTGRGILDSFSKRTDMAYALGLLRSDEKRDMSLIRKIRNSFAHEIQSLSFDTDEIRNRCFELKSAKDTLEGPLKGSMFEDTPRFRFTLSVAMIGNFISYRTQHVVQHRTIFPQV